MTAAGQSGSDSSFARGRPLQRSSLEIVKSIASFFLHRAGNQVNELLKGRIFLRPKIHLARGYFGGGPSAIRIPRSRSKPSCTSRGRGSISAPRLLVTLGLSVPLPKALQRRFRHALNLKTGRWRIAPLKDDLQRPRAQSPMFHGTSFPEGRDCARRVHIRGAKRKKRPKSGTSCRGNGPLTSDGPASTSGAGVLDLGKRV